MCCVVPTQAPAPVPLRTAEEPPVFLAALAADLLCGESNRDCVLLVVNGCGPYSACTEVTCLPSIYREVAGALYRNSTKPFATQVFFCYMFLSYCLGQLLWKHFRLQQRRSRSPCGVLPLLLPPPPPFFFFFYPAPGRNRRSDACWAISSSSGSCTRRAC